MNKIEILDSIHLDIHALRLLENYKPSIFEVKLNKKIAEAYKDNCKECERRLETLNNTEKKSFFGELFK